VILAAFQARGILAAPVVELPGEPPLGGYRRPPLDAWRANTPAWLAQGALRDLQ